MIQFVPSNSNTFTNGSYPLNSLVAGKDKTYINMQNNYIPKLYKAINPACKAVSVSMRMVHILLFVSLFFLAQNIVFAQTRSAPTNNVQQIQNWSSFTFQGQRFARMVTSSVADTGDTFYLMLDLSPPCSTVNMRLSFQHEKPLTSPVTRNWLILMWPDGVRSIGGHVTYNGKVGDQVAIFTLNEMPKFPELYQRMVSGQFVGTDLGNQDGKILASMRFSLMGFTDSYKRIDNLCRRM
jgi:hypothetical protein